MYELEKLLEQVGQDLNRESIHQHLLQALSDYTYVIEVEAEKIIRTHHAENCFSVTGYEREELKKNPRLLVEMIPQEDRNAVEMQLQEALTGCIPHVLQHRIRHKSGGIRWVKKVLVPHLDSKGKLVACSGILTDITRSKEAEQAMRRHVDALESIYGLPRKTYSMEFEKSCGQTLLRLDELLESKAIIIQVRTAKEKHLAMKVASGVLQTDSQDVSICPSCRPREMELQFNDELAAHSCAPEVSPETEAIHCEILDEKKQNVGCITAVFPVGAGVLKSSFDEQVFRLFAGQLAFLRKLAVNREELIQQEKHANLGHIASILAHEVRNPLNGILLSAEMLKQHLSDRADLSKYFERIQRQAKCMSNLMTDLLEVRKPLAAKNRQVVDLMNYLPQQIKAMSQQFDDPDEILFETGHELSGKVKVEIDAERFGQVLTNILANAREHNLDDHPIYLYLSRNDQECCIAIQDSGRGIEPRRLDQIFEAFVSTRSKGSGLGLYIAKHIVQAHEGRIQARNNTPDPGATLRIFLPLHKSE